LEARIASIDLDEAQNVIRLGVREENLSLVRGALANSLRDQAIDSQAVKLEIDRPGPLRSSVTWASLTGQADTIVGGLEIGNSEPPFICSVGFGADYNGSRGFITASHCSASLNKSNIWNVDGSVAHQPSGDLTAYGAVGIETADPSPWNCGIGIICRRSDASFYHTVAQAPRYVARGLIAHPSGFGPGARTVDPTMPHFIVVGEANGVLGQTVAKVGRTTGWTQGTITATCVDRELSNWPTLRRVKCTNQSSNALDDGDSGGSVFLYHAGSLVFLSGTVIGDGLSGSGVGWSTITQIQLDYANALGVTRLSSLTTPGVAAAVNLNNSRPALSWQAVTGATKYGIFKSDQGGPFAHHATSMGTAYEDASVLVNQVLSGSPPFPGTPYVGYRVLAIGSSEVSLQSNTVYLRKIPPPPTISAQILGPSTVKPAVTCMWQAIANGGSGTYTYEWKADAVVVGSDEVLSYATSKPSGSSFILYLTVSDGQSTPGVNSITVSVSTGAPVCNIQ
jgi:hypothetical protein